jgi:hypothetical protein
MSADPTRANKHTIPSNRPQPGWVDYRRIRNRDGTFTTNESEIPVKWALSAIRWAPNPSRPKEWVVRETVDGLAKGDPSPAPWLPQGWTIHYFPIGLHRGDLASWFDFAERVVNFHDSLVEGGRPWPGDKGAYIPSAEQIADHAFLLLAHLKKQKMLRSGPVNRPRRPLPPLLAVRAIREYVNRHLHAAGAVPVRDSSAGDSTPPFERTAGGAETRQGIGDSPPTTEKKRRRVPKAEAEILVADWLEKHAKENPAAVKRDQIAAETGVSTGGVSQSAAFKAFDAERKKRRNSEVRTIPLSDRMQATVPADCGRPDELAELIEEQDAEKAEEECRSKRRHRPS